MDISVLNLSYETIPDEEMQTVLRAVNHQLRRDFAPHWGMTATMRLEAAAARGAGGRARDAVVYLRDELDVQATLAYHERHHRDTPWAAVFAESSKRLRESWTVTLSHEILELVADPYTRLLVPGPHPSEPDRDVFYWYEMANAVQTESYLIEGVEVSNFLLPAYFSTAEHPEGRTDFLGLRLDGEPLAAFGVHPGGFIGFFDPHSGESVTGTLPDDSVAADRLSEQQRLGRAGRRARYAGIGRHRHRCARSARSLTLTPATACS